MKSNEIKDIISTELQIPLKDGCYFHADLTKII